MSKNPFPVQTGSRFPFRIFKSSLLSNLNTRRLNFENPSDSSHVMSKNHFPVRTGVDFQRKQFSVITSIELEQIPFEFGESVHKYSGYELKTCFRRSFSIFLAKPEVDSKNERQRTLFCIKLELLAFEF